MLIYSDKHWPFIELDTQGQIIEIIEIIYGLEGNMQVYRPGRYMALSCASGHILSKVWPTSQ
jgi:hypothetical protein